MFLLLLLLSGCEVSYPVLTLKEEKDNHILIEKTYSCCGCHYYLMSYSNNPGEEIRYFSECNPDCPASVLKGIVRFEGKKARVTEIYEAVFDTSAVPKLIIPLNKTDSLMLFKAFSLIKGENCEVKKNIIRIIGFQKGSMGDVVFLNGKRKFKN